MKLRETVKNTLSRIGKDLKNNGVGLAAAAACFILLGFIFKEVCPMQILFGIPCPACGLTRAGIFVLKGQFEKAFYMNPFIYAWLFYLCLLCYNRYVKGRKTKYAIMLLGLLIFAMVIFYIYRMVVWFPNKEPMTFSRHRPIFNVSHFYSHIGI